jgi:hypothetical protein
MQAGRMDPAPLQPRTARSFAVKALALFPDPETEGNTYLIPEIGVNADDTKIGRGKDRV